MSVFPNYRPLVSTRTRRSPVWWLRYVPAAVLALVLFAVLYAAGRVAIIPLLVSFALAYLLNPLVEQFERRGLSRAPAALSAMALVAFGIAAFALFVIPDLWDQSVKAGEKIYNSMTPANASNARAALRRFSPILDQLFGRRLYGLLSNPGSLISPRWSAGLLTGFVTTATLGFDLLLAPFFIYYILVDFAKWRTSLEDLIPLRFREPFQRLFDEVGRILQAYVLGQLMIALCMAVGYAIGFAILRIPAAAGLAALAGLLNMVPYVGTISGALLASGFSYAQDGNLWRVSGVLTTFVVVQCIEGYILTPKILGGRLRLHPMAVLLGLLIFGKLFGFLGILLAVPTIAVGQVFMKLLRELYKHSKFYHNDETPPEEKPPEAPEERLALAADTVLAEQVSEQAGDELLAPAPEEDDPAALART